MISKKEKKPSNYYISFIYCYEYIYTSSIHSTYTVMQLNILPLPQSDVKKSEIIRNVNSHWMLKHMHVNLMLAAVPVVF